MALGWSLHSLGAMHSFGVPCVVTVCVVLPKESSIGVEFAQLEGCR